MGNAEASRVFERDFLPVRAQIVALAAALDRLDRANGREQIDADERMLQIRQAFEVLVGKGSNRAERIQLIFSDAYEEDWLKAVDRG